MVGYNFEPRDSLWWLIIELPWEQIESKMVIYEVRTELWERECPLIETNVKYFDLTNGEVKSVLGFKIKWVAARGTKIIRIN